MHRIRNSCFTRPSARHLQSCIRSIFSTTGEWPSEYTCEVRQQVEEHWKPRIQEQDKRDITKGAEDGREKFYVLSMFPYPSGHLHMGHVRVYTISDAMARYHRATGKQVIHPMGWDGFGLPAENAAIDRGKQPADWTYSNIASMQRQLHDLSYSFEYERGFATCDPEYYKWTQFLFLKLYEHGLAYQKEGAVNWDPVDETVLADEQVDEHGCSWRSGARVERRFLKQWYIKTSAYAQSLNEGLEELDAALWGDVLDLQRNWIGQCNGVRYEFTLFQDIDPLHTHFSVFTTQPQGLYGVSHVLVSPQHYLNQQQFHECDEGDAILLNVRARHFMRGSYIPIYVHKTHDFGEHLDAHLGMPCLDEQDHAFANAQLRQLRYMTVIDKSGMVVNSGKFSHLTQEEAGREMAERAMELGRGGYWTSERCRDWCVSRQRYWGTPIPMLRCGETRTVPVPYDQLPVLLPPLSNFRGKGGRSPLAAAGDDWLKAWCPKSYHCACSAGGGECCGRPTRETDTMDTFVDSSWYFLRYLNPRFSDGPFDAEQAARTMPVDLYIGGKEHAIMHLYYARFFCHFLHDLELLPEREPFRNLLTQGVVKSVSYRVKESGKYLHRDQVDFSGEKPVERGSGAAVSEQWEKMSKSKHNGVDPRHVIAKYGADATRLGILGNVAPKSDRLWSEEIFTGIEEWQRRIWNFITLYREQKELSEPKPVDPALVQKYNHFIRENRNYFLKEVDWHLSRSFLLSTAIARLQGLANSLRRVPKAYLLPCGEFERALHDMVVMVSVFAPLYAAELRAGLGRPPTAVGEWPQVDSDYRVPLTVRVNRRAAFKLPMDVPLDELQDLTKDAALALAQDSPQWKEFFAQHQPDFIFLNVTHKCRAELDILCHSLAKEKKQNKKKREQNKVSESRDG